MLEGYLGLIPDASTLRIIFSDGNEWFGAELLARIGSWLTESESGPATRAPRRPTTSPVSRRILTLPRRRLLRCERAFPSRRRSFEARVGLVACRFLGHDECAAHEIEQARFRIAAIVFLAARFARD